MIYISQCKCKISKEDRYFMAVSATSSHIEPPYVCAGCGMKLFIVIDNEKEPIIWNIST